MKEQEAYELFDEMLDEQGDIEILGMTYTVSQVLKEVDHVAYQCMFNDFADGLLNDDDDEEE